MSAQTQDRIKSIQRKYLARRDQIANDPTLSDVGRRRASARTWKATKDEITALRQDQADAAQQEAAQKLRSLFGVNSSNPATVIAYRDAQDRAAQVKSPAEAMDLYARAQRNGDDMLAKAVAERAWHATSDLTPAWAQIVESYLIERPAAKATADRICQLTREQETVTEKLMVGIPLPPGFTDSWSAEAAAREDTAPTEEMSDSARRRANLDRTFRMAGGTPPAARTAGVANSNPHAG